MTDEDKQALHELISRTLAMMTRLEEIEHRVATVIEGGRQQLGHLVGDLHIREMQHELREISTALKKLTKVV